MTIVLALALIATVALATYHLTDRVGRPLRRTHVLVEWKRHRETVYDPAATMFHHMHTQAYDEDLYVPEKFEVCVRFADETFVVGVDRDDYPSFREHGAAVLSYCTGRWSGKVFPVSVERDGGRP